MSILVTGAYGFVGTNLSNVLKDKYILWALDTSEKRSIAYSRYFSWENLEMIPWDDVDTIIHLAGKAHDTKSRSDAQVYFDVNTGLTRIIFDYFLQSKAKQFIFFSSVKAVDDKVECGCLTEDVIPCPKGPYGESKMAAEAYIQKKIREMAGDPETNAGCRDDKRFYIFRPCMIHGAGNKGNLNLLYGIVRKGVPYPLGAFDNKRSFLNVSNLSYIVEQFIQKNPDSGVYHLADDDPISTNEIVALIARVKNKKTRIWNVNRAFITAMAKIGTVCRLPFNSERLHKLTENYVVSNEKVKKALKINHLPVDVRAGFLQTLSRFDEDNNKQ